MLSGGVTPSSSPRAPRASRWGAFFHVRGTAPQPLSAYRVVVRPERQRHHVIVEPVNDGTGLRRRPAVGLLDRQLATRFLFVERDELIVDVAPQLASRVIGNVQNLNGGRRLRAPFGVRLTQ